MRRASFPLSILIAFTVILTGCGGGHTETVYRDRTVTSIVYRDTDPSTATQNSLTAVFSPEQITWLEYCSEVDHFCASFPQIPGATTSFGAFDADTIEPTDGSPGFRAYGSDLPMKRVSSSSVVYCNSISEVTCDQADTSHGVANDNYSVFVMVDRDPSLDMDNYDRVHGDCGGRVDRKVTSVTVSGVDVTKITCRYSYNSESYRTLYLARFKGMVYEVNASNQTDRPHFGEKFLASFRFTA